MRIYYLLFAMLLGSAACSGPNADPGPPDAGTNSMKAMHATGGMDGSTGTDASIGADVATGGEPCGDEGPCPLGEYCSALQNICSPGCASDDNCPEGLICGFGGGTSFSCIAPSDVVECPPGADAQSCPEDCSFIDAADAYSVDGDGVCTVERGAATVCVALVQPDCLNGCPAADYYRKIDDSSGVAFSTSSAVVGDDWMFLDSNLETCPGL